MEIIIIGNPMAIVTIFKSFDFSGLLLNLIPRKPAKMGRIEQVKEITAIIGRLGAGVPISKSAYAAKRLKGAADSQRLNKCKTELTAAHNKNTRSHIGKRKKAKNPLDSKVSIKTPPEKGIETSAAKINTILIKVEMISKMLEMARRLLPYGGSYFVKAVFITTPTCGLLILYLAAINQSAESRSLYMLPVAGV